MMLSFSLCRVSMKLIVPFQLVYSGKQTPDVRIQVIHVSCMLINTYLLFFFMFSYIW